MDVRGECCGCSWWRLVVEVVEVGGGGGEWWMLWSWVVDVSGGSGGGGWWRGVVEVEHFHWLNMLQVYCLTQIFQPKM